jgi:hypothetical protein
MNPRIALFLPRFLFYLSQYRRFLQSVLAINTEHSLATLPLLPLPLLPFPLLPLHLPLLFQLQLPGVLQDLFFFLRKKEKSSNKQGRTNNFSKNQTLVKRPLNHYKGSLT